jgi:integrase
LLCKQDVGGSSPPSSTKKAQVRGHNQETRGSVCLRRGAKRGAKRYPGGMAQTRRGHGEDSIYFDVSKNRYLAAVSLGRGEDGKRQRRKVSGRTKTEVKLKLRALREEIAAGAKTSAKYTVGKALDNWLDEGLDGRSAKTVDLYRALLNPVKESIGAMPLKDLSAHDVRAVLTKIGDENSSRTVQITKNCMVRAITHAQANDHVIRNVASLVTSPQGQGNGRPSKSLTPEQAAALLAAAKNLADGKPSRLAAYVVLCLTTGIRTEEARALRWDHVDLDNATVAVWRSVRAHGDVKTALSRRTLQLPQAAVEGLKEHKIRQAEDRLRAGGRWQDTGLVFTTTVGTEMDRHNVLREFRKVTVNAGLGKGWTPRELRHSFVSLLSANGVAVEEIARVAGHSTTRTTELVYRRELRPVITTGAEIMDKVFPAAFAG